MAAMNLQEAAAWLGIHERTLAARAAAGEIPGAKISHKAWRFLESDLIEYLRGKYEKCHSTNNPVPTSGLSTYASTAKELDALLAQRPKPRRKSFTTR